MAPPDLRRYMAGLFLVIIFLLGFQLSSVSRTPSPIEQELSDMSKWVESRLKRMQDEMDNALADIREERSVVAIMSGGRDAARSEEGKRANDRAETDERRGMGRETGSEIYGMRESDGVGMTNEVVNDEAAAMNDRVNGNERIRDASRTDNMVQDLRDPHMLGATTRDDADETTTWPYGYQAAIASDPNIINILNPDTVRRRILHKPLCKNLKFTSACKRLDLDLQALGAWRERVENERKQYSVKNRHARCPQTKLDPVKLGIHYLHPNQWSPMEEDPLGFVHGCPILCQRVSSEHVNASIAFGKSERVVLPEINIGSALRGQWAYENRGRFGITERLDLVDFLVSYPRMSDVFISINQDAWSLHREDHPCGNPRMKTNPLECVLAEPTMQELEHGSRKFAAAFISAGCLKVEAYARSDLVLELEDTLNFMYQRNQTIDFWGACWRTNRLERKKRYSTPYFADKIRTMSNYKFCLCFENSIRADYITEKMVHCNMAGSLPVYWGDPAAEDLIIADKNSYIDALDFPSPKALGEFLYELDRDHDRYLKYFEWRKDSKKWNKRFLAAAGYNIGNSGKESSLCRACTVYFNEYCGGVYAIE